jgi:hypothetical protein
VKADKNLRQLKKQSLCLQAQHYRLALRQEWSAFAEPFAGKSGTSDSSQWMSAFGSLLSILPNKWSRILGIGLVFWRLARRSRSGDGTSPEIVEK